MRLLGALSSQSFRPFHWLPSLLVSPSISGTPNTGNILTAQVGEWTGLPTSYGYQWQESVSGVWTNISGATNSTYTTDHEADYRVLVTASNAYGASPTAATTSVTVTDGAGPVNVSLAVFDPARTGGNMTLSNGNKTATHTSGSTNLALLQGVRSTGKYWVEIEMVSGAGVEYTGLGVANASANVGGWAGADANSNAILAYNASGEYDWQYNGGTGLVATGKPFNGTGSVMCGYFDNDNRKLFMYVKNGGTGAWITDDPNSNPSGGYAYGVAGDVSPLYCTYYQDVIAKLRIPSEFTESGVCPAGATMGWYTPT